jgi:hypothetical protein
MLTWHHGSGEYTIELTRDGERFGGTMTGTWNGKETSGRVIGYLHRPVPTVKL